MRAAFFCMNEFRSLAIVRLLSTKHKVVANHGAAEVLVLTNFHFIEINMAPRVALISEAASAQTKHRYRIL